MKITCIRVNDREERNEMTKMSESISDRIKKLRILRGLKQDEMGEFLDRSAMFVSRVERGTTKLSSEKVR